MTLISPQAGGLHVEITLPYHTASDLRATGVSTS
jgi:hypothetical protein